VSRSDAATDPEDRPVHFDEWLPEEFAWRGPFTALIVLVAIGERDVTPIASSFADILDPTTRWEEMAARLTESGRAWDAVTFFAIDDDDGGPIPKDEALAHLASLSKRIAADRLVLNEGHLFGRQGRRLAVEAAATQ
jgi:hypothetical protein